ncbi:MAG: ferritin-like domain-containing protein, partial [Elainella sp.]
MNESWNAIDIAGFDLPLNSETELGRILAAAIPQPLLDRQPSEPALYWSAAFLGLERVQLFQSASTAEQQAILTRANRDLLLESCRIEQAGIGYMAKMVLLAESLGERMLYGL